MCLGGGGGGSQSTTTTSTSKPPKYLRNMLSSGSFNQETGLYEAEANKKGIIKNPLGINQEAYNYYIRNRDLRPSERSLITGQQSLLQGRQGQYQSFFDLANAILGGNYNVGGYTMPTVNYKSVKPQAAVQPRDVKLSEEMKRLGTSDPSAAISSILSGKIDNPYLAGMLQSYINQGNQNYYDTLQNTMQTIFPQTRLNSVINGTYGGSREAIAEGLVGQQLAKNLRDLTESAYGYGTNLYGTAYASAQDRMAAMASQLAQQAQALGISNADRRLGADEFNAQLAQALGITNAGNDLQAQLANATNTLSYQDQLAQRARQNLATGLTGLSTMNMGFAGQDDVYNALMSLVQSPQQKELQTLQSLAGTILPQASPAYVQTSTGTQSQSGGSSDALGGMLQIAGLIASLFSMGG